MKASNVHKRICLGEKATPRTLTLKKPLGIIQELKIKSLVKEPSHERSSFSLNTLHTKRSQQNSLQEALELLRDLYPKSFTRETPKP